MERNFNVKFYEQYLSDCRKTMDSFVSWKETLAVADALSPPLDTNENTIKEESPVSPEPCPLIEEKTVEKEENIVEILPETSSTSSHEQPKVLVFAPDVFFTEDRPGVEV